MPQENADSGAVIAPSGKCLDTAGQLTPAPGSGLNWLRTADCDASSSTQKWSYVNNTIKSTASGQCVGVQSHWLWGQPMVSLMGCTNAKQSELMLHANGTLTSMSGYGCLGPYAARDSSIRPKSASICVDSQLLSAYHVVFAIITIMCTMMLVGVSNTAGPISSLWRKPMADGKTAVLAINAAALPAQISIDIASVMAPDGEDGYNSADVVDVWTGKSVGVGMTALSREVPPHGNIFLVLSHPKA